MKYFHEKLKIISYEVYEIILNILEDLFRDNSWNDFIDNVREFMR